MCIKVVVRDLSLCQCAGIEFFIKVNVTAALIDHLFRVCGDTNLGPSSIRHCDSNVGRHHWSVS